ncbi:MAG: hypothetical protein L0211_11735, partial [Planctomycetaceae bacterium]|nr:hypothetical protein [Planctomycetaceae bacterium]
MFAFTKCKVVPPKLGAHLIAKILGQKALLVTEDELQRSGSFPGRAIPLRGPGAAATAYWFEWHGKNVLAAGRIPIRGTVDEGNQMMRIFAQRRDGSADFLQSIHELKRLRPDIWLPAVPESSPNAYLYGNDWGDILSMNEEFVRQVA